MSGTFNKDKQQPQHQQQKPGQPQQPGQPKQPQQQPGGGFKNPSQQQPTKKEDNKWKEDKDKFK